MRLLTSRRFDPRRFMPKPLRYLILLALLATAPSLPAAGQMHRLIPLDHWAYEYVKRLQRRGHLLELNPTSFPYSTGEVRAALEALNMRDLGHRERRWAETLVREFRAEHVSGRRLVRARRTGAALTGGELVPGLRISTHDRLDPLRPLEQHVSTLQAGRIRFFPRAAGRLFLEYGPLVAQAGLRFDLFYRDDPDGLDAANRLIVRNEDAYAGIHTRYASVYAGRIERHWGPHDEPALLLSSNPVGMDQAALRIGGRRLALRSVLGELDSMTADGRFTGTAGADSVRGSIRRYLAAHRFDWRPSRRFSLSLMEAAVFSGANSGWSLKFLNPLNLQAFAVDGRPKNDENNGLLAGIIWVQYRAWTLHGQLMIDDVDLAGETGEPASLALSGSLTYAGFPAVDAGVALTAVSARAYNTHQPEGRYTHLLRGIATSFNDYIQVSGFSTFYLHGRTADLALSPRIDLLLQGAARIHQPYPSGPDGADFILEGTVQRTVRPALEVRWQGDRRWWARLNGGPAFLTNQNNVEGRDRILFTLSASLFARIYVAERFRLDP